MTHPASLAGRRRVARGMATYLIVAIATLLGHSILSTWAAAQDRPPNIIFLLADDQRPDTIHALGNPHIHTPNLDRLVAAGTTFTRAVSPYPLCVPSRAEMMTGASSFRNGMYSGAAQIDPKMAIWAATLQSAGYHTCYVGKWHTTGRPPERGYTESIGLYSGGGGKWAVDQVDFKGWPVTGYRGWVFQTNEGQMFPERGVGLTPNISADFADAALELIERRPEKPYFLHVNFTAPHDPLYEPPGYAGKYDPASIPLVENFLPEHPFDHGNFNGRDEQLLPWPRTPELVRRVTAMYYSVIDHLDRQIGRILDALEATGQAENTIVIFSSDHGLAVGSHGLRGKQNMYEHTVGVPLLIRGPGVPRGKQIDAQVYLRDLFPTTCDWAGVAIPDTVEGKSLVPLLNGERESLYPFSVSYFRDLQRMIRTDRWKLAYYPAIERYQLFDIVNDPLEMHDLVDDPQFADVRVRLRGQLVEWLREHGDPLGIE